MASDAQARNVKQQHGDELRRRYGAHTIMVVRDEDGSYSLHVQIPPGSGQGGQRTTIDGVDIWFQESEAPTPYTTRSLRSETGP